MRICTFADALLTILPALTAGAADNTPPEWFSNLFNSKDLTGWKGLVTGVKADAGVRKHLNNTAARAKFSPEELAAARAPAAVQDPDTGDYDITWRQASSTNWQADRSNELRIRRTSWILRAPILLLEQEWSCQPPPSPMTESGRIKSRE